MMNSRLLGLGVASAFACIYAVQAPCQTPTKQTSAYGQRSVARVRGSLGAASVIDKVSKGDFVTSTSTFNFQSKDGVELRFEGFGNLQTPLGKAAPFEMRLVLEVSGLGIMFDGAAPGLNGQKISVPSSLTSAGIEIKLSRENRATKNVLAGTYTNEGRITISKM